MLQVLLSAVIAVCFAIILSQHLRRHFEVLRCDAYLQDIKAFSTAFRTASRDKLNIPKSNDDLTGLPKGMEAVLKDSAWVKPSPLGGNYVWISPISHHAPAAVEDSEPGILLGEIGITAFPPGPSFKINARELEYLKNRFAKGAVPGVSFQIGFNGWPLCLIHQKP
jgi:hypothetical protein